MLCVQCNLWLSWVAGNALGRADHSFLDLVRRVLTKRRGTLVQPLEQLPDISADELRAIHAADSVHTMLEEQRANDAIIKSYAMPHCSAAIRCFAGHALFLQHRFALALGGHIQCSGYGHSFSLNDHILLAR